MLCCFNHTRFNRALSFVAKALALSAFLCTSHTYAADAPHTATTPAQSERVAIGRLMVDATMRAAHPELVQMIVNTESMDDAKKQYFFDILPFMTPAQIDKLFNILYKEKQALEALDKKYAEEMQRLLKKNSSDNAKPTNAP